MNAISENLNDRNQLLQTGKLLAAFDKYCHDEVIMY
jgi:hypothetical protein